MAYFWPRANDRRSYPSELVDRLVLHGHRATASPLSSRRVLARLAQTLFVPVFVGIHALCGQAATFG